jgi:hypothetical protein
MSCSTRPGWRREPAAGGAGAPARLRRVRGGVPALPACPRVLGGCPRSPQGDGLAPLRVGAAAVAGGALVIWLQGGPVPALAAHFSGFLGLLSQFGRPMVHVPTPGAFCGLRWP